MEHSPLRLGFLASHNGTDMQAIVGEIEAGRLDTKPIALISNNSRSVAAEFAQNPQHKMHFYHISSKTHENPNEAIADTFLEEGVELIICSGYMKPIQGKPLVVYKDKIWNPHPADPQKYGGLWGDAVHEAVLRNNDTYTYPTINVVDEGIDTGRKLAQGKVKVEPDDTVLSLRNRVQLEEIRLLVNLLKRYKDDK